MGGCEERPQWGKERASWVRGKDEQEGKIDGGQQETGEGRAGRKGGGTERTVGDLRKDNIHKGYYSGVKARGKLFTRGTG